jgi:muramidase (phage lysozyme)
VLSTEAQVTIRPEPAHQHALAQIRSDLARFELGSELQANVQQHYRHLETLTASLKTIGVDDEVIDRHVIEIFNKYKEAMLENIERLGRERLSPRRVG